MSDATPPDLPGTPDAGALVGDRDLSRFPCESCGGEMSFDPDHQKLRCQHCDHLQPVPLSGAAVEEIDLRAAERAGVGRGYGVTRKSIRCESCGAITSYDDDKVSVKCAFCDSGHVVQEEDDPSVIAPASVLPFQINRAAALAAFKQWLKKRWFKPGDLVKTWALEEIRGVYVPFWTFDSDTDSNWTAMAGYHYYVTETYTAMEDGKPVTKTRQVQHTRWEPAAGRYHQSFDDELVCASRGLEPSLVRKLYPYDTTKLLGYQPQFLAGWEAERYRIDLKEGWAIGRQQMSEQIRAGCARMIPGDTHKDLRVNTRFADVTFKHTLLPVWVAAYHYRKKLFNFLVNAQTGQVSGSAPISWIKVTALVLVIAAAIGVAVYFSNQ